jgi:hypothetical protein
MTTHTTIVERCVRPWECIDQGRYVSVLDMAVSLIQSIKETVY